MPAHPSAAGWILHFHVIVPSGSRGSNFNSPPDVAPTILKADCSRGDNGFGTQDQQQVYRARLKKETGPDIHPSWVMPVSTILVKPPSERNTGSISLRPNGKKDAEPEGSPHLRSWGLSACSLPIYASHLPDSHPTPCHGTGPPSTGVLSMRNDGIWDPSPHRTHPPRKQEGIHSSGNHQGGAQRMVLMPLCPTRAG